MTLTLGGLFGFLGRSITRNSVLFIPDVDGINTKLLDELHKNTIIERTCIQGE